MPSQSYDCECRNWDIPHSARWLKKEIPTQLYPNSKVLLLFSYYTNEYICYIPTSESI